MKGRNPGRRRIWIELARRELAARAVAGTPAEAWQAVVRGEAGSPAGDGLESRLAAGAANKVFTAEKAEAARMWLKRRFTKHE
ncbi:hypothetical protein MesoLjLc_49400 [Mesorhizobium sp. L-8-10]|nr:hypothetical protein MesoLjLc_49400 [Mesorhizobium sp. L-8-10]